jgi:hypothetical protein
MKLNNLSVEILNNKISDYEYILSKFSNWKENKRQINLLSLLDGKKIEFDVEIENSSSVFYIGISDDLDGSSLISACAVINKLTFIITEGLFIESLKLDLTILNTKFGNVIKELLNNYMKLEIHQGIDEDGQVYKFYFDIPKKAA